MVQLYTPLHTANNYFKKQFLSTGFLLFILLYATTHAGAQCLPPPAPVVIPNPAVICINNGPVKLVVQPTALTSQFCSGPVNIAVPDNTIAGVSNSIVAAGIPAACTVSNIAVTINMSHTRMGDMVFVLKSPNGQIINLNYRLSGTGGSGTTTGFVNTVISSTGTTLLSTGTNPWTGTFKADLMSAAANPPAGPTGYLPTTTTWNGLYTIANGSWTLAFYDAVTGETGTLNSWCLNFTYACTIVPAAAPAIWSPSTGLYTDPACTVPYIAGTPTDTVYARPAPSGTYIYQVTHQSLPNPPIAFTNPAPINIPIGGAATPYSSDITVSGVPTTGIRVKSVVLNGIIHTKSEDIDIALQSPTGQTVLLMSDNGGANSINATYTILDSGFVMNNSSANPTGSYRPSNFGVPDNFPAPGPGNISQALPSVSMFTGNYNGTWKLFVLDDDGTAGQGAINGGFTINFDTTSTYCTSLPTSVTVVAGAAPVITIQPADQTVCIGNNAQFSVISTGTALTYQWQVTTNGGVTFTNLINGGVFSGVNTATLTVTAPPVSMSGQRYRVIINGTGSCASVLSNAALLTVNALPVVSFYPHPYSLLLPGLTTTLQSVVSPAAATYTWLHDGIAVLGGIADTLLVDFNNIGVYQLRVTDINGCTNISDTMSIRDSALGRMFVYPNPSSGNFQVRLYTPPNAAVARTLMVYNNMGNRIITKPYTQTMAWQQIDVDVRRNGKGVYWIEIVDKDGKRISMSRVLIQ
jgi:subtilisin-like proprotein convertase family protein